ncbi:NAD-dependent epimerase/dehydratase family protein [Desulfosoma caldarium]|uniref:UDP-glucose 4-epimerase n=1 Tax=Desulfosoma caldarium TaxID=610254 RepID=A0A3N1UHF7_9BACT|nr:NAD-dependent epimerase/dehydratase family protein [Desulfosoma caldarium]ROQ89543.1 UDP-glucose 4-epimerase [Desulfosoma caldarium]
MDKGQGPLTTCVVTGAAGFVGSHLCERLLSLGHTVVGVDNFFSGRPENLKTFASHPRFFFHERSVTETGLLTALKDQHGPVFAVFHLAAIVSVPYSLERPEETFLVNTQATLLLLEEAEVLGVRNFVFAGSAAEYGDRDRMPLTEADANEETRWLSPYGEAKYRASVAVASRRGSLCGVSLRCFNIYGPRQDPSSPYSGVISRFVNMAVAQRPLTIFGDGLQTRDFVFVSDVVDAYCLAGLRDDKDDIKRTSGVFNVGSGRATSIVNLARLICRLTHRPESITFGPERPGDIRHSTANIEAITRVLQWKPRIGLKDGLTRTIQWMRGSG